VEARWTDDLPPVPRGHEVTVSLSSPRVLRRDGDALRRLGYTIAGICPSPPSAETRPGLADFLVRQETIEAHRTWWRTLADRAERTYSLSLGPVLVALADVLAVHLGDRVQPERDGAGGPNSR
jgi:hypothetical protein